MSVAPPKTANDLRDKVTRLIQKLRTEAHELQVPPVAKLTNARKQLFDRHLTSAKNLLIQADVLDGWVRALDNQTMPADLLSVGTLARLPLEHLCLVSSWPAQQWNAKIAAALTRAGFTKANYAEKRPRVLKLGVAAATDSAAAIDIRRRESALRPGAIPGYFSTPPAIIARMLEYADIHEGDLVLEPSAGNGSIADAIRTHWDDAVTLHVCERDHDLAEILRLKNHTFAERIGQDFLNGGPYDQDPRYDRIVMNPPCEKHVDCRHIKRAYDWLAPDGALVAVVSDLSMVSMHTEAVQFRIWLQSVGAEVEALPNNAFKPSGSDVRSHLVMIGK